MYVAQMTFWHSGDFRDSADFADSDFVDSGDPPQDLLTASYFISFQKNIAHDGGLISSQKMPQVPTPFRLPPFGLPQLRLPPLGLLV